jgi:hypothetical protein
VTTTRAKKMSCGGSGGLVARQDEGRDEAVEGGRQTVDLTKCDGGAQIERSTQERFVPGDAPVMGVREPHIRSEGGVKRLSSRKS